jgi:hypothetical protein
MKTIEKTWSEQILERGLEQRALQARREVLLEQVRARFGAVPDPLTERIAGADRARLDRLLVRVVTVSRVEDLLDQ